MKHFIILAFFLHRLSLVDARAEWQCTPQFQVCINHAQNEIGIWQSNVDYWTRETSGLGYRITQCWNSKSTLDQKVQQLRDQFTRAEGQRDAYSRVSDDFSILRNREMKMVSNLERLQTVMGSIVVNILTALRNDLNQNTNLIQSLLMSEVLRQNNFSFTDKMKSEITIQILNELKTMLDSAGTNRKWMAKKIQDALLGDESKFAELKKISSVSAILIKMAEGDVLSERDGALTIMTVLLFQSKDLLAWVEARLQEYVSNANGTRVEELHRRYKEAEGDRDEKLENCNHLENIRREGPDKLREAEGQVGAWNSEKTELCRSRYCIYERSGPH